MNWGMSNNNDFAMLRSPVGAPGMHGYGVGQSLTYLGGPRDKMQQEEAEKNRQLQLTMQQNSMEPFRAKQAWMERLFPTLQAGLNTSRVGGQVGGQPDFKPAPVYTEDQMGEQVNAARAQNDARTATQQRLLGQSAAARGFGAASPGIEAQRRSLAMANMRENATAEREIPFQAAQANADSMFRGQQLEQDMWQGREDSDIRRRQQQLQSLTSLLGLLG